MSRTPHRWFALPLLLLGVAFAGGAAAQINHSGSVGSTPTSLPNVLIYERDEDYSAGPPLGGPDFSNMNRGEFTRYINSHYSEWHNDSFEYNTYIRSMNAEQMEWFAQYKGSMNRHHPPLHFNTDAEYENYYSQLTDGEWQVLIDLNPDRNIAELRRLVNTHLRSEAPREHTGQQNIVEGEGDDAGGAAGGESSELPDGLVSLANALLLPSDYADTTSSTTVWESVQLLAIYDHYISGQHGLTWASLDLFPHGPSSVGNSLNMTIDHMPSAVGWSLDLYPPALCGH